MLQLKLTLAYLLRKIELSSTVPEHKIKLANDAVLKAVNGVKINIKIRQ